MQGRKPLPSKVVDIMGGSKHSHRPPRSGEPNPLANIPKCPSFLDKGAKKEWKRISRILNPLGMITDLDLGSLAKYCESFSQWAQASRKIQETGMLIKGKMGIPTVNPLFKIANNRPQGLGDFR